MSVEEVDMSVPVVTASGGEPRDAEPAASEVVALASAAVRARRRPALTRRSRERRERDYDNALKRIAKRLAAELAGDVPERRLGERLRVRAYTEVVALASVLRDDCRREARRARQALIWSVTFGLAALAATGVAIYLAGGGVPR